jgi:putative Ca2+/H+ antiporter (TMEM165/GDT1 family)
MDLKLFATVAGTVFVAELGDKTQLATLLFAAEKGASRWTVFAGASVALIAAAGLGVLAGGLVERYLEPRVLSLIAGITFMVLGAYTLYEAW